MAHEVLQCDALHNPCITHHLTGTVHLNIGYLCHFTPYTVWYKCVLSQRVQQDCKETKIIYSFFVERKVWRIRGMTVTVQTCPLSRGSSSSPSATFSSSSSSSCTGLARLLAFSLTELLFLLDILAHLLFGRNESERKQSPDLLAWSTAVSWTLNSGSNSPATTLLSHFLALLTGATPFGNFHVMRDFSYVELNQNTDNSNR